MAETMESRRERIPREAMFWNVLPPQYPLPPDIGPEFTTIQRIQELRDLERQVQRVRAVAERAYAESRVLEPRHAPLISDLAVAVQEAEQAEMRAQTARVILESASGLAPSPAEIAAHIPRVPEYRAMGWPGAALLKARDPPIEIRDTGKELVVNVELPGVDREDVEIQARDTSLYVCAEREREEAEAEQILATERLLRRFERKIWLPEQVVPTKANAVFKNGILEVTLPKKHPGEPPQRVSVK